jgi:serine/threonine-protein kinase HipA
MLISGNNRMSRIASCLEAAHHFLLSAPQAVAIVQGQIHCIAENWPLVSAEAALSGADINLLWGRQFLNPYAFTALEGSAYALRALADELRSSVRV